MAYGYQNQAPAQTGIKRSRPTIRVLMVDVTKKTPQGGHPVIPESEISLWKNQSKGGKEYFSGKDKKGNKYVGFFVADKQ